MLTPITSFILWVIIASFEMFYAYFFARTDRDTAVLFIIFSAIPYIVVIVLAPILFLEGASVVFGWLGGAVAGVEVSSALKG